MRGALRNLSVLWLVMILSVRGQEVGISTSPVYFTTDKILSLSLHAHFMYPLSPTISLGISIERIILEPQHSTILMGFKWNFAESAGLIVSAGITREDAERRTLPSLHFEVVREFKLSRLLHLGPTLEVAYDTNDFHAGIGLHISLDWGNHHQDH